MQTLKFRAIQPKACVDEVSGDCCPVALRGERRGRLSVPLRRLRSIGHRRYTASSLEEGLWNNKADMWSWEPLHLLNALQSTTRSPLRTGGGGCIAADVDQASFASLYFSRWNVAAFILSCLSVWPEGWQRQSAGTAALCSKLKPHYCSRGAGGTGGSPGASAHGARRFPWPQFSSASLQKYVLCFWVEYLWLKSVLIPVRANLFHQQTSTKMISADPAYWTFSPQAEQTCPLQELETKHAAGRESLSV